MLRASNITFINLFDNLAICALVGHKSFTNLSLLIKDGKSDWIDDIFPSRQFLSALKVGHSTKKWNSVSGWWVEYVPRGGGHQGGAAGVHGGGGWVGAGLQ